MAFFKLGTPTGQEIRVQRFSDPFLNHSNTCVFLQRSTNKGRTCSPPWSLLKFNPPINWRLACLRPQDGICWNGVNPRIYPLTYRRFYPKNPPVRTFSAPI